MTKRPTCYADIEKIKFDRYEYIKIDRGYLGTVEYFIKELVSKDWIPSFQVSIEADVPINAPDGKYDPTKSGYWVPENWQHESSFFEMDWEEYEDWREGLDVV